MRMHTGIAVRRLGLDERVEGLWEWRGGSQGELGSSAAQDPYMVFIQISMEAEEEEGKDRVLREFGDCEGVESRQRFRKYESVRDR